MFRNALICCLTASILSLVPGLLEGKAGRFRLIWQEDPSVVMTIGWDQLSGTGAKVYFDVVNQGPYPEKYAFAKGAERVIDAKGMKNHFVRLAGLRPNTTFYFLIADSEGVSQVFSFRTAPDRNTEKISIIAGSDSRNHREARVDANKLVAKLRPLCVMFGGDFTENDSDQEWQDWFDDWQHTISKDGRMYPIIVARGNHEYANQTLTDLFDIKAQNLAYALSIGGDLLRIWTLNSMAPSGGDQLGWFKQDLAAHNSTQWKLVQYHLAIRPHTKSKEEKMDQYADWAGLFYDFGVQLAVESDAHVVKSTYPLRPSIGPGSEEGYLRDDDQGTVYIGEGCWGAPLRVNNDPKSWTRAHGSFNCFHLLFIEKSKMEIRFVKTDGADYVASLSGTNPFEIPRGLNVWNPPTGDVILIPGIRPEPALATDEEEDNLLAARGDDDKSASKDTSSDPEIKEPDTKTPPPLLLTDPITKAVKVDCMIPQAGNYLARLIGLRQGEVRSWPLSKLPAGTLSRTFDLKGIPPGRYLLVIRSKEAIAQRYRVVIN
jgi:hypothetical protein